MCIVSSVNNCNGQLTHNHKVNLVIDMAKKIYEKSSSRSFRLVCAEKHINAVENLLYAEGFAFEPEVFSTYCRVLTAEPRPLGSSLAARLGLIYIQDRSSMLPPLSLFQHALSAQNKNACAVLDMCASPGSKTGFLAQLVGNQGFVFANEPSKARLATLRANMQQLGFLHVSTCTYAGEQLPLTPNSWQYIQLDPPCSGWGTVDKNPKVLTLWKGKKINPLIELQRKLLQKAHELLCPGGYVVYSTCTTNTDENEQQIDYAVHELGFEVVPLEPFDSFAWEDSHINGTLRVDGARSNAQGFYIAKLRKTMHEPMEISADIDSVVAEIVHPSLLEDIGTDVSLLPEGDLMLFGQTVRFVPRVAKQLLNANVRWQAAAIGKMVGGRVRLLPNFTLLMPNIPPDSSLVLEDIKDIYALLQGQSLQTGLAGRETGLYYANANTQALPLGRVTLKQGRAIWSGR